MKNLAAIGFLPFYLLSHLLSHCITAHLVWQDFQMQEYLDMTSAWAFFVIPTTGLQGWYMMDGARYVKYTAMRCTTKAQLRIDLEKC